MMTHWNLLLCLLLGVVLGGLKGRFEKRQMLPEWLRPWAYLALLAVVVALSFWKIQPAGWDDLGAWGVNVGVSLAALWVAFSWSRWFFGPIRWN